MTRVGQVKRAVDRNGNQTLSTNDGLGPPAQAGRTRCRGQTYEYDGEGRRQPRWTAARSARRSIDNWALRGRGGAGAWLSNVPWIQEHTYLDTNPPRRIEEGRARNDTAFDLDRLYRVVKVTDPDGKFARNHLDGVNKRSRRTSAGNRTRHGVRRGQRW